MIRGDVKSGTAITPGTIGGRFARQDRAEMTPRRRENQDAARSGGIQVARAIHFQAIGQPFSGLGQFGGVKEDPAMGNRAVRLHLKGHEARLLGIGNRHVERLLVG